MDMEVEVVEPISTENMMRINIDIALICLFYIAVSISNVLYIDTALETRVTKYVSTTKINMYRIMIYFCKLRLEN